MYRAELPLTPPRACAVPVAIKRARWAEADHHELDRELTVLARCVHAHLLPLLGYCRCLEAPCIIFPLMQAPRRTAPMRPLLLSPSFFRKTRPLAF